MMKIKNTVRTLKIARSWALVWMSALMVFSFTLNSMAAGHVYEKNEVEKIGKGVTRQSILRFHEEGWFNANVIYVDLTEQTTEIDFLTSSGGLTTKETLTTMANNKENVIGAINADYFYMVAVDSPLGIMIKDGEMISSPIRVENQYATLYVNREDQAIADFLTATMKVVTDKGKEVEVQIVNKVNWEYQMTTLVDKHWGKLSPGATATRTDHTEVVIVDNVITNILVGQPAVEIPENGYILVGAGAKGQVLRDNLQVGDQVSLQVNMMPDIDNIKFAIGGGSLLVKEGKALTSFTLDVSGNHPRTAVGLTQDRRKLVLVTVDGRHQSYKGVNGQRMAQFMVELGCYEAVMLDGGGSTTMVSRSLGDFAAQLVNTPSDGSQRRIINGIAVVSTAAPAALEGIVPYTENNRVFLHTPRNIQVKAYDLNENPLTVDPAQISLQVVQGSGTVNGNQVTPTEAGTLVVEVDYLGKKETIELTALVPAYLEIKPTSLQLTEGGVASLTVEGISALGYRAPVAAEAVTWQDEKGLGTVELGQYTAGNVKGDSVLTGKLGQAVGKVPVSVGTHSTVLDSFDGLSVSFNSYPQEVTGSVSLTREGRNGTQAVVLNYDFTTTDVTRAAYMDYPSGGLLLPGTPVKVGVWVFASQPSTQWIRARVTDANGTQQVIDLKKGVDWTGWQYLEGTIPTTLTAPVKLDRLYVAEPDGTQLVQGSLIFDDLQVIYGGSTTSLVFETENVDPLYQPITAGSKTLVVHKGFSVEKETLLDRLVINNLIMRSNKANTQVLFTGTADSKATGKITSPMLTAGSGHESLNYENALILKMDNSKQGFRATNFSQWTWLQEKLATTDKKNLVFLLPKPIWGTNGFTDALEADLLAELLTEQAEKGKNVYVFYGGTSSQGVELKEGVRYIATGAYQRNPQAPARAHQYIELGFNGEDLIYQVKPIFQ